MLLTFSIVGDKLGISITMWSGSEKALDGAIPMTCVATLLLLATRKLIWLK